MSTSRRPVTPAGSAGAVAGAAAALLAGLLLAFVAGQYAMPATFQSPWGLNPEAVAHFRQALHGPVVTISDPRFRVGLLVGLVSLCAVYVVLCAATMRAGFAPVRAVSVMSVSLAVAMAVFCPPTLSADVYAYVGYARLAVVHHINPYTATQLDLVRLHDPTGPFLYWPISSPYGPLWTLISMVPVAVLPSASLWTQVVIMKLVAAAGVVLLARGGRRLAERLAPGRGDIAFVALALNPLFLIEGPGNGHNDLVITALVLWTLAAMAEGRPLRGLALAGLGGAVKFFPLVIAPWLIGRAWRRGSRTLFLAAAVGLALGPLVASYAPFWHGMDTLAGIHHRWQAGHGDPGRAWIAPLVSVAAYAALSAWVIAGDVRRAVAGWIGTSVVTIVFLVGIWFPWYVSWPSAAALALPSRRGWTVAGLLFLFATLLTLRYAAAMPAP